METDKKTDTKIKITLNKTCCLKKACTVFKLGLCLCQIEREALVVVVCISGPPSALPAKIPELSCYFGFLQHDWRNTESLPSSLATTTVSPTFSLINYCSTNQRSGMGNTKLNKLSEFCPSFLRTWTIRFCCQFLYSKDLFLYYMAFCFRFTVRFCFVQDLWHVHLNSG